MQIDRYNYEEFFLLYVDNELSTEERKMVEEFVALHSDLEEEFVMLQQSKLIPDEDISFDGKELLFRSADIHPDRTDLLISYLDNELNEPEKGAFEQELQQDTELQKEFALFRMTRMEPDTSIVFPDKNLLYREEKQPARVIAFNWRRLAVAAVLLLLAGATTVMLLTSPEGTEADPGQNGFARNDNPAMVTPKDKSTGIDNSAASAAIAAASQPEEGQEGTTNAKKKETTTSSSLLADNSTRQLLTRQSKNGSRDTKEAGSFHKTASLTDPNTTGNETTITTDTYTKPVINEAKTIDLAHADNNPSSLSINTSPVTPVTPTALNRVEDDGNNKSRGLFRKVTRVFERATNIDPANDDNKILIGSFAVSLK